MGITATNKTPDPGNMGNRISVFWSFSELSKLEVWINQHLALAFVGEDILLWDSTLFCFGFRRVYFFFNAFNVFIHFSDWLLYIIAATGVVVALLITIVVVVLCKRAKGEKVYRWGFKPLEALNKSDFFSNVEAKLDSLLSFQATKDRWMKIPWVKTEWSNVSIRVQLIHQSHRYVSVDISMCCPLCSNMVVF